jgi:protein gp37
MLLYELRPSDPLSPHLLLNCHTKSHLLGHTASSDQLAAKPCYLPAYHVIVYENEIRTPRRNHHDARRNHKPRLHPMAQNTSIEWTDTTWNPVTGCTKISAGCDNCYAARFSERFRGVPGHPFENGFDLTLRPERVFQPLSWKKPRMIFVNSMSDLFHKAVPKEHIARVFDTMERADWHIYQVLTKRSSLLQKFINNRYENRRAPPHMWFGVSVENAQATSRIVHLQKANAAIRFLSVEPLIGPVGKLDLAGIDWVIVGGESGPRARSMQTSWAVDVRNQCLKAKVAFFFKQWGGRSPKSGGRLLEGKEWNEFPMELPWPKTQYGLELTA